MTIRNLHLRVDDDLHTMLSACARQSARSLNAEGIVALEFYVVARALDDLQRPDSREALGDRWEDVRDDCVRHLATVTEFAMQRPGIVHAVEARLRNGRAANGN